MTRIVLPRDNYLRGSGLGGRADKSILANDNNFGVFKRSNNGRSTRYGRKGASFKREKPSCLPQKFDSIVELSEKAFLSTFY